MRYIVVFQCTLCNTLINHQAINIVSLDFTTEGEWTRFQRMQGRHICRAVDREQTDPNVIPQVMGSTIFAGLMVEAEWLRYQEILKNNPIAKP